MADQRLVNRIHREEQSRRETAQGGKDHLSHRRQPSSRWTPYTDLHRPGDGSRRCSGNGYAHERGRDTDCHDNRTFGWRGGSQIFRGEDSLVKLRRSLEGPDRSGDGELQKYATSLRPVDGSRIHIRHYATHHGHQENLGRYHVPGPKRYGNLHSSSCLVLQSCVDYHHCEEEREIWACHFEHPPCICLSRLIQDPEASR